MGWGLFYERKFLYKTDPFNYWFGYIFLCIFEVALCGDLTLKVMHLMEYF
jgi:hypothetical protein